jgi:hypothetical protein
MSTAMIPDVSNGIWEKIINGQETISFEFMAANILTRHIQGLYASEADKEHLQSYTKQLRELFTRNSELPSVKNDLYKISKMVR